MLDKIKRRPRESKKTFCFTMNDEQGKKETSEQPRQRLFLLHKVKGEHLEKMKTPLFYIGQNKKEALGKHETLYFTTPGPPKRGFQKESGRFLKQH